MQHSLLSSLKKNVASEVRDFRHISLIGGFIKLLLKSWPTVFTQLWKI